MHGEIREFVLANLSVSRFHLSWWAPLMVNSENSSRKGAKAPRKLAVLSRVRYNAIMSEQREIRVYIADDFDIMRQVIRALLREAEDIEVVGEGPRLDEALAEVEVMRPDVILMNDYLPPVDSAYATERFRALGVESAILIISMYVEPELIRGSFDNGANGFMHKDEMGEHLVEAIRRVYQDERYLSPKAELALE